MSVQPAGKLDTIEAYDELPYERLAYPLTQPPNLSMVASLFGLKPVDFKTARVLELGCAIGGNLFPLALRYPDAHFVGIDLSQGQIDQAKELKQALKLSNIEFLQQDILKFTPPGKDEKFDYIICHGIYSWVPDHVREGILDLCSKWLSMRGLAVISYNALPGWNAVKSLREMMLYHNNRLGKTGALDTIQRARNFLVFLAEGVPENLTGYRSTIENEITIFNTANSNSYLYHDHLESENTPFYFSDFIERARRHGLDYVGDTTVTNMYVGNMPPKALEEIKNIPDVVEQEQYMDFVTNRRFRSTILCRNTQKVDRAMKKDQIMDFYVTLNPAVEIVGADPQKGIDFKMHGNVFTISEPIACALFAEMALDRQRPIDAKDLINRVQKKLGLDSPVSIRSTLVENGLELILRGFLSIYSDAAPHFVTTVSEKPAVFPLARHEAAMKGATKVTNALSHAVPCDLVALLILQNLDGTKTKEDMAGILTESIRKGVIRLESNGTAYTGDDSTHKAMISLLDGLLPKLAEFALLVG